MKSATPLILAVTFILAGTVQADIIDEFSDGDPNLSLNAQGFVDTQPEESGLSEVIAGNRYTSMNVLQAGLSTQDAAANVGSGYLALASDPNYVVTWDVVWGKNTNLDFDIDGTGDFGGIFVDVITADSGATLTITLESGLEGTSQAASVSRITTEDTSLFLPFSGADSFLANNASINLDDIDRITMTVAGLADGDYTIERIETTVPEPATAGLLALGGLGLVVRSRRRRNAA